MAHLKRDVVIRCYVLRATVYVDNAYKSFTKLSQWRVASQCVRYVFMNYD